MNALFKGKEGSNNRRILDLLLAKQLLNRYTIARQLGLGYSVVYDRVEALDEQGILEKKEERPGKKNRQPTALWGLSALGLWVQAHRSHRGKAKCGELVSEYWKKFTEVYRLDHVQTELPLYALVTEWLKSDVGLLNFLDTFGHYPLIGESQGLLTFRRMMDLGLLRIHGNPPLVTGRASATLGLWSEDPYKALGEIAREHGTLRKLHETLREVDAPLYAYLNKGAYQELVQKLSKCLPASIAEKLARTPFFSDQSADKFAETLSLLSPCSLRSTLDMLSESKSRQTVRLLGKEYQLPIYSIVIEQNRICIVTDDPDSITPGWKDYCHLYVIRKQRGKITVERMPARRAAA